MKSVTGFTNKPASSFRRTGSSSTSTRTPAANSPARERSVTRDQSRRPMACRASSLTSQPTSASYCQPRSYLLDSILGVKTTQMPFSPRYPIELSPIGTQSIPQTSKSAAAGAFGVRRAPAIRRSASRRSARAAGFTSAGGPTYVFRCPVCGKTFNKKSHDSTLNKHKNNRTGHDCFGTFGIFVKTKY